jgi:hypothetical protein
MSAKNIYDLLPIPEGTKDPHAYQVFGLEPGEQDLAVVAAAVKSVVARVKEAKPTTDAKLWSQVAKIVQDARVTLADPDKKAKLDARFGIIAIESPPPPAPEAASTDPLAGVLPPADPLASVLPQSNPLAPSSSPPAASNADTPVLPTGILPVPSQGSAAAPEIPSVAAPIVAESPTPSVAGSEMSTPVLVKPVKPKRRKGSKLGMMAFTVFTIGMLAIIGLLTYFLMFSDGPIAITKTNGKISISKDPVVARPQVEEDTFDPVMGNLGSRGDRLRGPSGVSKKQASDIDMDKLFPDLKDSPSADVDAFPMSDGSDSGDEESGMDDSTMSDGMSEDMSEDSPSVPDGVLTEEAIAEADTTLEKIRAMVRGADWANMKATAEAALKVPMNDSQKSEAESLYELTDLATYYRTGIENAVAELEVGNEISLTDDVQVIVVETGPDRLVVRRSKKNYTYTFDELPFSLAEKLANNQIAEGNTLIAAQAVYQAIAPKTNVDYREESIGLLRDIQGEVEGADPVSISRLIQQLFAE